MQQSVGKGPLLRERPVCHEDYLQHYPNLRRYAFSLVHDEQRADEMALDAIETLWLSDRQPLEPRPYLFRILRNRWVSDLGAQASRQRAEGRWMIGEYGEAIVHGGQVVDYLEPEPTQLTEFPFQVCSYEGCCLRSINRERRLCRRHYDKERYERRTQGDS